MQGKGSAPLRAWSNRSISMGITSLGTQGKFTCFLTAQAYAGLLSKPHGAKLGLLPGEWETYKRLRTQSGLTLLRRR